MTRVYYGTHSDGLRYAARDKPGRHHRSERCEHAVWGKTNEHQTNHVVWVTHAEGDRMHPFLGPDDAWDEITKDGVHLWKHNPHRIYLVTWRPMLARASSRARQPALADSGSTMRRPEGCTRTTRACDTHSGLLDGR